DASASIGGRCSSSCRLFPRPFRTSYRPCFSRILSRRTGWSRHSTDAMSDAPVLPEATDKAGYRSFPVSRGSRSMILARCWILLKGPVLSFRPLGLALLDEGADAFVRLGVQHVLRHHPACIVVSIG